MLKTNQDLKYVMTCVNNSFNEYDSKCMPAITTTELDDVTDFANRLASNKLSVDICTMLINHMTNENATTPDNIAESIYEHLISLQPLSDQKQNEIYDAIHSLASCLIKDIGQYL